VEDPSLHSWRGKISTRSTFWKGLIDKTPFLKECKSCICQKKEKPGMGNPNCPVEDPSLHSWRGKISERSFTPFLERKNQ
jgi:hypothetical protein